MDCPNPRCNRQVAHQGFYCCNYCILNDANPQTNPMIHSKTCHSDPPVEVLGIGMGVDSYPEAVLL